MFPVPHWARVRPWWKARSLRSYERSVWLRRTAVATNFAATTMTSRWVAFVNSTDFGSGATSWTRPFVNGVSLLWPVFEKKIPRAAAVPAPAKRRPTLSARRRLRGEEKKRLTRPRLDQGRPAEACVLGVLVGADRRRLVRHPGGHLPLLAVPLQADDECVRLPLRARLRREDDRELRLARIGVVDLQRHLSERAEPRHHGDVPAQPLLPRDTGLDRRPGELPRLGEVLALHRGKDEPPGDELRRLRHRHVLLGLRGRGLPWCQGSRAVDRLRRVPEEDEQEGDDPGHEHEGRDPRSQAHEAPGVLQAGRVRRHALRVDEEIRRWLEDGGLSPDTPYGP